MKDLISRGQFKLIDKDEFREEVKEKVEEIIQKQLLPFLQEENKEAETTFENGLILEKDGIDLYFAHIKINDGRCTGLAIIDNKVSVKAISQAKNQRIYESLMNRFHDMEFSEKFTSAFNDAMLKSLGNLEFFKGSDVISDKVLERIGEDKNSIEGGIKYTISGDEIYYINFENNGECHYRMFNIIDGELTEDELDEEKEHSEMLNNLYHLEREKEKSTDD